MANGSVHIVTWTAFPYHTLHIQPIPLAAWPDCKLYCVGRLSFVPPNNFKVRLSFNYAHVGHSFLMLEWPTTLEHSRSLNVYCQRIGRICFQFELVLFLE